MRLSVGSAVLLTLIACAKMLPPPGGPPDLVPPSVLGTRPESLAVYPGFTGDAEFQFDETVSEGGRPNLGDGSGDLERMIVLSPSTEVPRIHWERSRITVRPREGWRPNTVYRIELLPGLVDLRRNRMKHGSVITFSTGAPLPTDSVRGIVLDWTSKSAARLVSVEAILLPDSLHYFTKTDSTGRFALAPLPHGSYLLRAFNDLNNDRKVGGREAWDTAAIAPAPSATMNLWLAMRDTVGPRLMNITPRDSQTIDIQLSQLIDPYQLLDSTQVRLLLLPDSTPLAVLSFRSKALDDSLVARARAVSDSLRADSTRRAQAASGKPAVPAPAPRAAQQQAPRPQTPRPQAPLGRGQHAPPPPDSVVIKLLQTRPALSDRLVVRTGAPLTPVTSYALEIRGVRNVNGATARSLNGFKTPPPPKVAADSTASDSTAAPAPGQPRPKTRVRHN